MATLLVIDDEPGVRASLRRILKLQDHTVHEAGNGQEGLALYEKVQPDLVIVDVMMPVKDGFDTIRELRAAYPWARMIAVTGTDPFLKVARDLGAQGTIRKPMRDDEVLQAVASALGPTGG